MKAMKSIAIILSVFGVLCFTAGCYSPFLNKSRLIVVQPDGEINIQNALNGDIGHVKGVAYVCTFPASKNGEIQAKSSDLNVTMRVYGNGN